MRIPILKGFWERQLRPVILCSALAGIGLITSPAMAADTWTPARRMEVVAVRGSALPQLLDQQFSQYAVFAVADAAGPDATLLPIPFQFDDLSAEGLPCVAGGTLQPAGRAEVLDAGDELVFMLKDTGPRASAAQLAGAGDAVAEIALTEGETTRYAYILKGARARSDARYALYDAASGLMRAEHWQLQIDPVQPLIWSDLWVDSFRQQRSVLDTMKLRVHARLGLLSARLTNDQLASRVIAVANGPVRSVVETEAVFRVFGIKILTATVVLVASANALAIPVVASIPAAAGLLRALRIELSLDFQQLEGASVRSASTPTALRVGEPARHPLLVDQRRNWLAGSHPDGLDIIGRLTIANAAAITLAAIYRDTANGDSDDRPERFAGSHPQLGWALTDLPTGGEVALVVDLYFGDGLWSDGPGSGAPATAEQGPEASARTLSHPLVPRVTALP